ncbi:hypothetical protein [Pseudomonas nitroreducens]|uniref:hypothetical protein n=1 Tax=Pseudomonas nitroreducens TaxID=46680 RepID=UPI0018CAFA04|nr:hypothetical protein [Pseudomonas nitroreducens]
MARSRNIKPSFFKNEDLADLPPFDRLLFIGLWCLADREGRLEDRPRRIKIELFPGDGYDVEVGLANLQGKGFIDRYEVAGFTVISLPNFARHQSPHSTEKDSELPDCNGYLTVNERHRGKVLPGKQRFVHAETGFSLEANNSEVTVKTPDQPAPSTVDAPTHNALIPDSLIPDYLNPEEEQEQPLPLRGGSDLLRDRLVGLLARRFSADSAVDLHNEVQGFLEEQGFECVREYPVEDRGDGRAGRVDLVVKGDDGSLCGIELDRDAPREKSLFKLAQLPAAIVLLRSPYDGPDCIDGVAVISAVSALPAQSSARKKRDPAFDPLAAKPANVSAETWARWVQHRKEIRKPLTPTSCSQQAAQLATCPNPDAVIAKSIASGWQGLFPDKAVRGQAAKPSSFTNLPKHNADPNSEESDHDGPNF